MFEQDDGHTPPLSERIAAAEAAEHEDLERAAEPARPQLVRDDAPHSVRAAAAPLETIDWRTIGSDPNATDSQWVKGLLASIADARPGIAVTIEFTAAGLDRLRRIQATCEYAEEAARLSPVEQLSHALTRVIVQELVAINGVDFQPGGRR